MDEKYNKTAVFIANAIRKFGGFSDTSIVKVMDFGCGSGHLVQALSNIGFDAYGCDIATCWTDDPFTSERLRTISLIPYQLPYKTNTFDIIISTSVLEHAQNKEECFLEIHRVLKVGGYAMHLYPGKWHLPYEPHIFIPLVNYFWPYCPKWWLALWALLGKRNDFQHNMTWRKIYESNLKYCQEGLSYWSTKQYRKLSMKVFGNCTWPMQFYIVHGYGGLARLCKRLPFKELTGILSREMRTSFLVQQKME